MKRKLMAILAATLLGVASLYGCTDKSAPKEDLRELSAQEYSFMNLAGTDALGRKIEAGAARKSGERYVGIFYSLWEGQHPALQKDIKNIQQLLDSGEDGKKILADRSDAGQFYYWGEPLYGYYNTCDPWVIMRHIELLTMAGVDFLCVDATNTHDYLEAGTVVLTALRAVKEQGFNVPKVCFYTNTSSGTTAAKIYKDYYESGEWDDLWFAPNGRPVIVGITENNGMASDQTKYLGSTDFVSPTLQRYFEVKESEWPNGIYNENSMPWMSWDYEQLIHNGYIAVPVAQHGHINTSVSNMSPESHRGYNNVTKRVEGDWREGLSFEQMWETVFKHEDEVSTVLVCSWNEWMAQKQNNGEFVDVYNHEYSRDIEMMKGGYGDNYYLQLCRNIRNYKLTKAEKYSYPKSVIDMNADNLAEQFASVAAHYKDFCGDAMPRNYRNAASTAVYTDNSNRNDITDIKVAHDGENLYFLVQTKDDVTEYNGTDKNWMNILIGDGKHDSGFAGYQYIINRSSSGGKTSVDKYEGGEWKSVGEADIRVSGKYMAVCVPLKALGRSESNLHLQFKVADNVTNPDDIMDYYVSGDSAPLGRLGFGYGY